MQVIFECLYDCARLPASGGNLPPLEIEREYNFSAAKKHITIVAKE